MAQTDESTEVEDSEEGFETAEDRSWEVVGKCIARLVDRGEDAILKEIIATRERAGHDTTGLRRNLAEANKNFARIDWKPHQPADVLRLVRDTTAALVRDAEDLFNVVRRSLRRFEDDLRKHNLERLWNQETPKRGKHFSREIEDWLRRDLKVIANREVQIDRLQRRTDHKIEAKPTGISGGDPLTVIIEDKCSDNRSCQTSIKDQLLDKYLAAEPSWNHGIYVVAWFGSKWKGIFKSRLARTAQAELDQWTADAIEVRDEVVGAILIDCSREPSPKKKGSKEKSETRKTTSKKTAKKYRAPKGVNKRSQ